jgi:putative flippase GtrA
MTDRLKRFALVALVPSAVDVTLLVLLRQGLGWILILANLAAIAVAGVVSYVLHRIVTFRSDPYVRWIHAPAAFVVVSVVAAGVDVVVLRALFAATGFTTAAGLIAAKAVSLGCAAAVRIVAYRAVLMVGFTQARRERVERPAPPGRLRLSVVIPAFDEADRIADTVGRLRSSLTSIGEAGGLELVVVDDGSRDATADRALEAGADQVVVLPRNTGKGAAVRSGMMAARGRTVAFTDADLAYAPDQVLRIVEAVEDGWDVAIGDRRHPETTTLVAASWLRSLGSKVVNVLVHLVLLGSFRDTQCGLKGCRSDVGRFIFSRAQVDGFAFDIEMLHLVERHEFSVVELPVEVANSTRSTVHPGWEVVRLLWDIARIRHRSATGAYETEI